jgi:Protein of unknown function (DUF3105)
MARWLSGWGLVSISGLVLAACGSSESPAAPVGQPVHPGDASTDIGEVQVDAVGPETGEPLVDGATCTAVAEAHALEGNLHMALCSPLIYATNPPSSGNHYPIWAAYRTYTQPFLPGFWVHSLEHGAVVIGYHCPEGCADEVARAQAFIDALPADCGSPPRRVILLPNPGLDVRFAASAWGFTLRADCFDEPSFAAFVAAHYAHGLEDICTDGVDPLTAGQDGAPLCP